ncbi:MAG: hypothetical protein H6667_22300 [Ardenticatenaceae bacterium]|nr:hypothetical protein [Ardenticatenaceae bacterium]MCB9444830.1 hypothetical protein [Ardenticatenaceae bacterium]
MVHFSSKIFLWFALIWFPPNYNKYLVGARQSAKTLAKRTALSPIASPRPRNGRS